MDQPTPPDRLIRTAPPKAGGSARARAWLIGLALTLAAGIAAWQLLAHPPAPAPAAGGRARGGAQPVGITIARTGDIRIVQDALGTVTPLATVTVRTQIAGQLQTIGFTEGQKVAKGDFLAQIDPRPYQALLAQYQGQLAKDQGALDQARVDLARYQKLLKQDSIARQTAEDQLYVVAQDEGTVRADQALIDAQKLNLTYCHIVAPVSGRVGLRQVDAGNYVQTSDSNGLVVITQLQPISVIFNIPEDVLPQVQARLASGATLTVAAYDRANNVLLANGQLTNLDNVIDPSTGTLKLRATFPNTDEKLFPSQFVNARLLIDTHAGVVTLPQAAVQHGNQGAFVYAVQDGLAHVTQVQTGAEDGSLVEITGGLAAGTRVVTDGTDRLRDGAAVTVQSFNGHPVGAGHHTQGAAGAPPAAISPGATSPAAGAPSGAAPAGSAPADGVPPAGAGSAPPEGDAAAPAAGRHWHHRKPGAAGQAAPAGDQAPAGPTP